MSLTVPRIQVSQVHAKANVSHGPAQVTTTNRAPQTSINSRDAQVSIQAGRADMEIEWQQTRNEIGLKDHLTFQRDFRDDSMQAGLAGIARIASEGDAIGHIENGGHPIADLAMARTDHEVSFNIGFAPLTPPSITFTLHQPRVEANPPEVNVRANTYPALTKVTPTPVQVDINPRGEIHVNVTGQLVDFLAI